MTHPDYSGIPAMHYIPTDRNDRECTIETLKELQVPFSLQMDDEAYPYHYPCLGWTFSIHGFNENVDQNIKDRMNFVTRNQFLAPFREVWEKHQFKQLANNLIDKRFPEKKNKPALIFPSDEEIDNKILIIRKDHGCFSFDSTKATIDLILDRIKELNQ